MDGYLVFKYSYLAYDFETGTYAVIAVYEKVTRP